MLNLPFLSAKYSAADDLESLAYILLAIQYSGQLPWSSDIDAACSSIPCFGEDDYDLALVIKTRDRHLGNLRGSSPASLSETHHGGLVELVDFVFYARGLNPGDDIDYSRWETLFLERCMRN